MNKKVLAFALLSLLALMLYVPIVSAEQPPIKTNELIIDTIGEPGTTDPAWAYDSTSLEFVMNVYEPLIFFDRAYTDGPYGAGKLDQFVPLIAESLPTIQYFSPPLTSPQGLPIYSRWTFKIRPNVPFHYTSGYLTPNVTPEDVEYTFERALVQDSSGGPTWMLYEALLGQDWASPPSGEPPEVYDLYGPADDLFGAKIDYAVQANATHVWFNLAGGEYPELAFKQILAQTWSGIVHKEWAINEGDLNIASVTGGWSNWRAIWDTWHDPSISFLDDAIDHIQKDGGSGPYKYDYWSYSVAWSVVKFDNYWQGWPAPVRGGRRLPDYVSRVTWNLIFTWTTRLSRWLAGTSDITIVPKTGIPAALVLAPDGQMVHCYYPLDLLTLQAFFFTFNISPMSPYVGVNKGIVTISNASTVFGSDGIPLNIFGIDPITGIDEGANVRKGFAYAFDYATYIGIVCLGEGLQPADPVIKGLPYDNAIQQMYSYKLTGSYSAEYYLKLAWGGKDPNNDGIVEAGDEGWLWKNGMKFTITYNTGNSAQELASNEIVNKVNSLNPGKFNLVVSGLFWQPFHWALVAHAHTIFFMGWLADYPDPHDFVFPFQHSQGYFSNSQCYENPVVDALVEAGILTPDDTLAYGGQLDAANPIPLLNNLPSGSTNWRTWPTNAAYYKANPLDTRWPRRAIYYTLQEIYYEDVSSVPLVQPVGDHWEQPWVRGWYCNSVYPGVYAYHLWKLSRKYGDVNNDGVVDMIDWSIVSSSWTGPPQGPNYFLPQADLTGGTGRTGIGRSGLVIGIPDGEVDIVDLAMVSAYWG